MVDRTPTSHDVRCEHCDYIDKRMFGEVLGEDQIECRNCGRMIDISSEALQEEWRLLAEELKHIKRY